MGCVRAFGSPTPGPAYVPGGCGADRPPRRHVIVHLAVCSAHNGHDQVAAGPRYEGCELSRALWRIPRRGSALLTDCLLNLPLIVTSGDDTYRMANPLTSVQRATVRRSEANASWRAAIRQAHAEGASLRQIAAAAGVSHVRILQIVRQR